MTQDNAVEVKDLSKIYRLYNNPLDRIKESLNPFGKSYHTDFYALNNVSFKIRKGETVGIIGKNGSGKSTLLKILTGVLTPSAGNVNVKGRISALLELGAGFNPELTGIQNVYLQGTIMGFSKDEMAKKMDDIIAFADIGDFVHQPVKKYSSGMFARLAFAVAINVDPEILIVDEALSVGDFMFQHKCLMKFKDIQEKGTTILFVSHTMQQIINYCNRAILIHQGKIYGDSHDVERMVFKYEELVRNQQKDEQVENELQIPEDFIVTTNKHVNETRIGTHDAIIREVYLTDNDESYSDKELLKSGSVVYLKLIILSKRIIPSVMIGLAIKDVSGRVIWGDNLYETGENIALKPGRNIITFRFQLNIVPGEYLLYAGLADISGPKRVELDQRWPVKKINIYNVRKMAEGSVYAPADVFVEQ